ncbi:MAG: quinone-dependent dihydroorotate dehydrogenase [Flavobacteriaceae bacterium]|jgi:dihydroorotate dehydrogenase|nr:dihydroorotate dehydrogenase (quinone) [Flavobacteriaceae bacterium]|tara:strand:- start:6245 stop:7261 length:1017 start_codon:yes stop_codon:yes gene_type:complete
MYKCLIRPVLFLFDPEGVHYFSFTAIRLLHRIPFMGLVFRTFFTYKVPTLEREVFGLQFPNPVGLAAGFDKDAKLYHELSNFGFGFIEIGTVTPKPQDGNPKPRLFRLKQDEGIINRMGFNNEGVVAAAKRLKKNKGVLIGGNIGKNKNTPNNQAQEDYLICFDTLFDVVDYFVVNVSSPNTPNLRDLQDKEPLTSLLNVLQKRNANKASRKPILLKIAPDLSNSQLDDIIDIVSDTQIDGVIATNTTLSRSELKSSTKLNDNAGGLSGKPLRRRSTEVISYLHTQSNAAFPIIGVGGIHTADDVQEKLAAGASLVQLYTGFVYEGPAIVKRINCAIK